MKWDNENIKYAKRLIAEGYTRKDVAEKMGVSSSALNNALYRCKLEKRQPNKKELRMSEGEKMILNSEEIKRRHHEVVHRHKVKKNLLRGKNKVNLLNVSNRRETNNERIKGTVIAEYDYFYLVDNGNYIQTVLKNSLVNGDIKVIGCS